MLKTKINTVTPWEPVIGYSRAVRKNKFVFISGTTATDENGKIIDSADPYVQAVQIFQNIKSALHRIDANLEDVVRTRIYLKNIDDWESVAKAHRNTFGEIRPANTTIGGCAFVDPNMLVEIEVQAIVD